MESDHSILWIANWMVSIPLIVLTIIIHVLGLGLIVDGVFRVMLRALGNLRFMVVFAILMTTTSALVVILHAMEGALWAAAYLSIGALSDVKSAMLYSLNAMTSYGHETRALNGRWALLGVQSHVTDLGAQDRWFKLESHDARAVLGAAGEGVLYTDVERRLGFYLRALWARTITLRAIGRKSAPSLPGERDRRVAIVGDEIHMASALDISRGQDGVAAYRPAVAHAAAQT